ncbi:MAG: tyrosine-type recombinase/integrase [Chitinispirillaceae bacterium]|nr:tyrosine-type recombinase/integrase [Chitinispirillaceae bacterium]
METISRNAMQPPETTGNRFYDTITAAGRQHSPTNPKSPEEWRKWWMKRYSFDLHTEKQLSFGQRRMYWAIVNRYLADNPGNPRAIPVERAIEFIISEPQRHSPALILFYRITAPSPKHIEAIKGISPAGNAQKAVTPTRSTGSPGKNVEPDQTPSFSRFKPLLEDLRKELSVRNYSRRTIRNYLRVVTVFLRWLGTSPTKEDAPRIMQYNLYLKEQSGFAPRTINLYSSAIGFFYRTVIKTDNITESVPRMKIGKPLPKVYSEQQIEKLIAATTNPKHRLVIMLAYGGGLRLEEIRLLRSRNFDFDKDCIRISKGKGRKDRVIMLDRGIKKVLQAYISGNPEMNYLFINDSSGKLLTRRTISKIFDNACKRSGAPKIGGIHTLTGYHIRA